MYRSRGNWAEDLGHDIGVFMKIGLAAIIAVPILVVIIVALLIWG